MDFSDFFHLPFVAVARRTGHNETRAKRENDVETKRTGKRKKNNKNQPEPNNNKRQQQQQRRSCLRRLCHIPLLTNPSFFPSIFVLICWRFYSLSALPIQLARAALILAGLRHRRVVVTRSQLFLSVSARARASDHRGVIVFIRCLSRINL